MNSMYRGTTHLICAHADALSRVCAELAQEGLDTSNVDAYVRTYTHFGVDEARELRERAEKRAVISSHRIFILAMPGMTNEAQNALLKTIEEPPGGAAFFFLVPSPEMFLPTFRSRTKNYILESLSTSTELISPETFVAASPERRIAMLAPLLEKNDNDQHDLGAVLSFLDGLERTLAKRRALSSLAPIYRARTFLQDKGALKKILLEQVALLI